MMKQDTTHALQQSQIKWNDKNTSAAISYKKKLAKKFKAEVYLKQKENINN
jgi:predicted protein tyrosine phosphatase